MESTFFLSTERHFDYFIFSHLLSIKQILNIFSINPSWNTYNVSIWLDFDAMESQLFRVNLLNSIFSVAFDVFAIVLRWSRFVYVFRCQTDLYVRKMKNGRTSYMWRHLSVKFPNQNYWFVSGINTWMYFNPDNTFRYPFWLDVRAQIAYLNHEKFH